MHTIRKYSVGLTAVALSLAAGVALPSAGATNTITNNSGGRIIGWPLPTWLLAIARNKALSSLRRRSAEPLDEEVAAFIEDPSDDPEETMGKQERSEILRQCLSQLSPAHREIIDLVYYHEKSVEEVSEIVGVPPATVKTRMFYARKRLAELVADRGLDRAAL